MIDQKPGAAHPTSRGLASDLSVKVRYPFHTIDTVRNTQAQIRFRSCISCCCQTPLCGNLSISLLISHVQVWVLSLFCSVLRALWGVSYILVLPSSLQPFPFTFSPFHSVLCLVIEEKKMKTPLSTSPRQITPAGRL